MPHSAMPAWEVDHAQTIRQLEALADAPGVSADYVRTRVAILQAQVEVFGAGLPTPPSAGVGRPAPSAGGQPSVGGPAVRPEMLRFDQGLAAGLLAAIVEAGRRQGGGAEGLERIAAAAARRPELVEDLALRAAFETDATRLTHLARETGTPAELLGFVARLIAAPLVVDAARGLEALPDAAAAAGGSCPICGSAPGLAMLDAEDGHRTLHCGLCGWSWRFARLVCPRCGCQDQAKLERLSVDDEDARWIETCAQCRGYLKTIDRRRLGDPAGPAALVEEIATLYLDLVAEQQGCVGTAPYAAMV